MASKQVNWTEENLEFLLQVLDKILIKGTDPEGETKARLCNELVTLARREFENITRYSGAYPHPPNFPAAPSALDKAIKDLSFTRGVLNAQNSKDQ